MARRPPGVSSRPPDAARCAEEAARCVSSARRPRVVHAVGPPQRGAASCSSWRRPTCTACALPDSWRGAALGPRLARSLGPSVCHTRQDLGRRGAARVRSGKRHAPSMAAAGPEARSDGPISGTAAACFACPRRLVFPARGPQGSAPAPLRGVTRSGPGCPVPSMPGWGPLSHLSLTHTHTHTVRPNRWGPTWPPPLHIRFRFAARSISGSRPMES
jgi:hypothetical protein